MFSKDRQSFKNENLEHVLRLRCDNNFSDERYEHAIELFLTEHPNGEVRQNPRRVAGHQYPKKRKTCSITKPDAAKALCLLVTSSDEEDMDTQEEQVNEISDINFDMISDDEWTDSDDDE